MDDMNKKDQNIESQLQIPVKNKSHLYQTKLENIISYGTYRNNSSLL